MRRRSSLVALVASSCNWAYGLVEPHEVDATVFDAHLATCPPLGELPVFDHADLQELIPQDCSEYTRGADGTHALAICARLIFEGDPDLGLVPAPGFEQTVGLYVSPRISDDGTLATVIRNQGLQEEIILMHRDADAWRQVGTISSSYVTVSEPTRGPRSHVLVGTALLHVVELADDGNGTWNQVGTEFASDNNVHLSPDGLRMWTAQASVGSLVEYWDRPTIDATFVHRGALAGSMGFGTAFMTPDCGRLYFSALNGVWFAHRPQ